MTFKKNKLNKFYWLIVLGFVISCTSETGKKENTGHITNCDTVNATIVDKDSIVTKKQDTSNTYISDIKKQLLNEELVGGIILKENYHFNNKLKPHYLEEDFNGDGISDLVIPIKEIKSDKAGFAVIHGETNEIFIIGAGIEIKNGLSDDMFYIDIWDVNTKEINEPGINEQAPLILNNPSIQIKKTEVGGGQIFWNGSEYEYFHQTC